MKGIRPRWRKVFTDLWENKARTLLVIISIAVGVFAIGMIAGAYSIISEDMGSSYASGNPANIELRTDPFDDELLKVLQKVSGVQEVEGRHILQGRMLSASGEWLSFDLLAVPDFEERNINLSSQLSGKKTPDRQEFLIKSESLQRMGASLGDELEFQLPDGEIKKITLSGVVLDQTTGAGDYLANPLGFISMDSLEWLHEPRNYNLLYVRVTGDQNDRTNIQQTANLVSDRLEKSGLEVYRTQLFKTNEHPMTSTVQAILGIMLALGVLIVFLSSSLIANTLSALLNQQLRQIGVMKLVGASSRDIFGMYMVLILIYGALALFLSVPLGGQAAYALAQVIADQLDFSLQGFRLIPFSIVLQVIIAIFIPLASGLFPVIKGSRITVQKAVSGLEGQDLKHEKDLFSRLIEKIRWVSRPLLISIRNTFRRKGRLVLTLFTLTLGGGIFIAVFNVQAALEDYINQVGNYFLADVNLTFDRAYRVKKIEQLVSQVPGVVYSEGWAVAGGDMLDEDDHVIDDVSIMAPPAGSRLVNPMLLEGRWVKSGDESALVINEAIHSIQPDLDVGDRIVLEIANEKREWMVVGIFKFVGTDNLIAYTTYEYLSSILNQADSAFTYRIITEAHDSEYQQQMGILIDSFFRDRNYNVTSVDSGLSSLEEASEGLGVLVNFLIIMAVLTAIVGSIGLMGTMGMNVMERTREIGVMRAIGAVDRIIILTVIVEGLLIGCMSWFLGAILSFPISAFLSNIISEAIFNTPMDFKFTLNGFLIWLVFVLVLSALASILPALNAARLTIREVLAYE